MNECFFKHKILPSGSNWDKSEIYLNLNIIAQNYSKHSKLLLALFSECEGMEVFHLNNLRAHNYLLINDLLC